MQDIQSQTWPVPVPCPHNEVAFNATEEWCETCGQVLSWSCDCGDEYGHCPRFQMGEHPAP